MPSKFLPAIHRRKPAKCKNILNKFKWNDKWCSLKIELIGLIIVTELFMLFCAIHLITNVGIVPFKDKKYNILATSAMVFLNGLGGLALLKGKRWLLFPWMASVYSISITLIFFSIKNRLSYKLIGILLAVFFTGIFIRIIYHHTNQSKKIELYRTQKQFWKNIHNII